MKKDLLISFIMAEFKRGKFFECTRLPERPIRVGKALQKEELCQLLTKKIDTTLADTPEKNRPISKSECVAHMDCIRDLLVHNGFTDIEAVTLRGPYRTTKGVPYYIFEVNQKYTPVTAILLYHDGRRFQAILSPYWNYTYLSTGVVMHLDEHSKEVFYAELLNRSGLSKYYLDIIAYAKEDNDKLYDLFVKVGHLGYSIKRLHKFAEKVLLPVQID